LDATVDAFKKGYLSRKEFWATLLVQLQNIKLVTFNCQDVPDNQWVAFQWADFTNDITLQWSPSHTPGAKTIMLALALKCGFNLGLMKFGYSKTDIFNQAMKVTDACFP